MGWLPDIDPARATTQQVIDAVRLAIKAVEDLMLTDAWEALTNPKQVEMAQIVETARARVDRLEQAFRRRQKPLIC